MTIHCPEERYPDAEPDGQGGWRAVMREGKKPPRGPAERAEKRAKELDTLGLAYRLASGVYPVESPHLPEARTLIVEALKAWERAHAPAALDPLLLDRP